MKLRVFHDGSCPLCGTEIRHLQAADGAGEIEFEDIHQPDFAQRFPHVDPIEADRILHGELADGTPLYGLDVTVRAWSLAGRGRRVRWLRWPLIRPLADLGYRFFARHRHRISRLLSRKSACDRCAG